ncbi:MAG: heavy metal translocating P-type ATPase [Eubacteriales bacterium]|nr:heavy metal translocating P-type ATPase [Eubacteriales bacterium]
MTRGQKRAVMRIAAALFLCLTAVLTGAEGPLRLALYVAAYLTVGADVIWSALRNILRGELFDEEFLMALATVGAFIIGEYPEAAGVMLFYQVGELFEGLAVGRSRRSIAALMDIRPDYATVWRDGREIRIDPEEVELGERFIVLPGERIPLDGIIVEGNTAIDSSFLTGEGMPEDKLTGDRVVSGTINLTGRICVQAESVYRESTVARILELTENAAGRKAQTESFITRFARVYTPCVVVGAVLLAVLPPLLLRWDWSDSIYRSLVFLMVSCPCALVVSVPMSFFGGLGGASRQGVLIKGANYLETLARVDGIVFDKTGTLTRGTFRVREVITAEGSDPSQLLGLAAAAERNSNHPVAKAICEAAAGDVQTASDVKEYAGLGMEAVIDGEKYYVGNAALMERAGVGLQTGSPDGTTVHVSRGSEYLGHIVVADELKPEAAEAVEALRKLGVKRIAMLTGDCEAAARNAAGQAGIEEYHAGLLPGQKVEAVEEMLNMGCRLAFVGDGINDAPVLSRADVGIAMGALGSDAAIEAADVVLMDDSLQRLPQAIQTARHTMRIVRQNIVFALGVKAAILVLGAMGAVGLWAAAIGDVGVMVLAVLNAMRALKPPTGK